MNKKDKWLSIEGKEVSNKIFKHRKVIQVSDSDEENEEVRQPVSNTEALIHLKSIIRYQEQSADKVFTSNELTVLRRKISVLECLIDKNKKQTTLDSFFEK